MTAGMTGALAGTTVMTTTIGVAAADEGASALDDAAASSAPIRL